MSSLPDNETLLLPAGAGYLLPVTWLKATQPKASIVMMAALGMSVGFYLPLASGLQAVGFNVLLIEQRGHGESRARPDRSHDWGFQAALVDELPAAMSWIRERSPATPLLLMGHSLGGHYAAMAAGLYPDQIGGVVLAACGSPWVKAFTGKMGLQLRLLCRLIAPVSRLAGYYPGHVLGFGGKEARTLMMDWMRLALSNRYQATGFSDDLDQGIKTFSGPVLSLRMEDDAFAPAAAVDAVLEKFMRGSVTRRVLTEADIGDRADHFRWARTPEAVAREVAAWFSQLQNESAS